MKDRSTYHRDSFLFWLILWAIVAAVFSFSSKAYSQERSLLTDEGSREQYRAVCQIQIPGEGQGSGTLIAARPDLDLGLVLTCRHVAKQPGKQLVFEWLWAGEQRTAGETVAVVKGTQWDTDMAIAVCKLPRNVKPLKVVAFDPANFPIVAAGFRDNELRVSLPNSNARKEPNSMIYLPLGLIKGMSGGPLLDVNGDIVGVVVASDEKTWGRCSDGPRLQALYREFVNIPMPDPSRDYGQGK